MTYPEFRYEYQAAKTQKAKAAVVARQRQEVGEEQFNLDWANLKKFLDRKAVSPHLPYGVCDFLTP
ncbi:MAG: hypothetical protein WCW26_02645 [Candidatus Buchananbacteria bacterium]